MGSSQPLICFYGDDFTGSTDVLGQFRRFGFSGVLLLGVPSGERLRELACNFDVVGVAGVSRALPTAQMAEEVEPALSMLAALGPRLIQYKVCSTFDSSPETGSIGHVIEIGTRLFGKRPTPVLVAQPDFGRYTVFGNHFALYRGSPYRLDRHPTMSRHPSTPMHEADLCRVLAEQTMLPVTSLNLMQLTDERASTQSVLAEELGGAVVIDAMRNSDLLLAAEQIWQTSDPESPRFVVGSGGLSYGVAGYLADGVEVRLPPAHGAAQVFAVCGSCSPQAAAQVAHAVGAGWTGIYLDPGSLCDPTSVGIETALVGEVLEALQAGKSVVVYTGDSNVEATPERPAAGLDLAKRIGVAFAELIDGVLARASVRRVVIAGGDTSGYTLRSLDAYALEVDASLAVAAPLCRLRSSAQHLDGVEIVLKGGQVGDDDFFELTRRGAFDLTTEGSPDAVSR